jgi:hypothetical protein
MCSDHAAMVPRVREIERAYDYTWGAARLQVPVRVFAPMWQDGWIAFNAQTYAHDILRYVRGVYPNLRNENRLFHALL